VIKNFVRRRVDRLASATVGPLVDARVDEVRYAVGALDCRLAATGPAPRSLRDTELKVFSQWGEDGVVQHLVRTLSPSDTFVEIGVGDYAESNTRFLLTHDNWRGAIFDGGDAHVRFVRRTGLAWRHSIDAVSAFVTRENVNDLVRGAGISGEIGLLSIDVDGVDYWLWDAVDVVNPWIVVVEYNSAFGAEHAVTVPYDAAFTATAAHPSGQYFGASLAALEHLARAKGYRLVGATSQGVNAFFVREDVAGDLWSPTVGEAYARSRIRTVRDPDGSLAYTGDDHRAVLGAMADRPLVTVGDGGTTTIGRLYGG